MVWAYGAYVLEILVKERLNFSDWFVENLNFGVEEATSWKFLSTKRHLLVLLMKNIV